MSEDSMRCRRAPELPFEMSKEDRRYRAAYHLLHAHIAAQIALGHLTGGAKAEAERVLASVEAELNPPAFEEVEESAGWVNIYPDESSPSGYALGQSRAYATKEDADENTAPDRISCQELRVKVKRPVKRPVVREVEGGVNWIEEGGIAIYPVYSGAGNAIEWRDLLGKTGTLVFRWEESVR